MIEPLDRSGHSPKAVATCDDCGHSQYETCDYERRADGSWRPNEGQVIHRLTKHGWSHVKGKLRCMACELARKAKPPEEEMIKERRLTETEARLLALADGTRTIQEIAVRMGWSSTGSVRNYIEKLAIYGAKAKPAGGKVISMEPKVVTDLRRPTREQKRQIVDLLTSVYDTQAERYRAAESDVTVAEAVGGGCMFGWVAEIREELFGPDGRNEELENLRADLAVWQQTADALATKVNAAAAEFDEARAKVSDFQRRLDILLKAAGPRGARVG
jgi:hypothetical protein